MPDKSERSHIESLVFVSPDTSPGSSVRYGDWEDSEERAKRCGHCCGSGTVQNRNSWWRDERCEVCRGSGRVVPLEMTLIDCATGSDYSGTLVEHSNFRTLKAEFPWLVVVHGGYGTFGLAYLGKRENQNPALIEAIDSLTDYPIYSDDDHSELEWGLAAQAWEDDGRQDFKRELVKHFDLLLDEEHEHDLDDARHNDAVDALWQDCAEIFLGGEEHLNEQGDQIYFPVYQLFKNYIDDRRFADRLDKGPYSGERGTIREQFAALCDASRIPSHTESDSV